MESKPKILVIVGPTATGKSDLAVELALKMNGEVISADSRQVYRGMDIGSGKITKEEMKGVPHHLLDVCNPTEIFTVGEFQKLAEQKITEIIARGKLPIICGGTGFYIDTLVQGIKYPEVPADPKLRAELELRPAEDIFKLLQQLDPDRAETIDPYNKVRLIRAVEIATSLGSVPKVKNKEPYNATYIGLDWPDSVLKERIEARLLKRLEQGMVAEVERLYKEGVSYERLESFGLEYKNCALFLQGKISESEMKENILKESFQYVKRQRTWFKRNKNIKWYNEGVDTNKII